MTCIIGLKEDNKIYVGYDSIAQWGNTRFVDKIPKCFYVGKIFVGISGYTRDSQLIQHTLRVYNPSEGEDPTEYLVNGLCADIHRLFSEFDRDKDNGPTATGIIVYKGHMYYLGSDASLTEFDVPFFAIGSGGDYAMGAMEALEDVPAEERVVRALEITSKFDCGVGPPFHVEVIEYETASE